MIDSIKNNIEILSFLVESITAITAIYFGCAWKKQNRSKAKYEVSEKILETIYKLQSIIEDIRNKGIRLEQNHYNEYLNEIDNTKEDLIFFIEKMDLLDAKLGGKIKNEVDGLYVLQEKQKNNITWYFHTEQGNTRDYDKNIVHKPKEKRDIFGENVKKYIDHIKEVLKPILKFSK